MIAGQWEIFGAALARQDAVSAAIIDVIETAISLRGQAVMAFPGGATPAPVFSRLGGADLDWRRVNILPTDDRDVAVEEALSNLGPITRCFAPLGARVWSLRDPGPLAMLPWPSDLVWLGVGSDGHTASIFPGPDLDHAMVSTALTVAVTPDPLPPEAPVSRISLTAAAIRQAGRLMIVISGAAKRTVMQEALADGARSRFIIGRVLAGSTASTQIFWSPD